MAFRTFHDFVIFAYNVKKDEHGQVQGFTVRVFRSPIGEGEQKEDIDRRLYGDDRSLKA
jgi:hypothetical protein